VFERRAAQQQSGFPLPPGNVEIPRNNDVRPAQGQVAPYLGGAATPLASPR
jgi:hypothetical protein